MSLDRVGQIINIESTSRTATWVGQIIEKPNTKAQNQTNTKSDWKLFLSGIRNIQQPQPNKGLSRHLWRGPKAPTTTMATPTDATNNQQRRRPLYESQPSRTTMRHHDATRTHDKRWQPIKTNTQRIPFASGNQQSWTWFCCSTTRPPTTTMVMETTIHHGVSIHLTKTSEYRSNHPRQPITTTRTREPEREEMKKKEKKGLWRNLP